MAIGRPGQSSPTMDDVFEDEFLVVNPSEPSATPVTTAAAPLPSSEVKATQPDLLQASNVVLPAKSSVPAPDPLPAAAQPDLPEPPHAVSAAESNAPPPDLIGATDAKADADLDSNSAVTEDVVFAAPHVTVTPKSEVEFAISRPMVDSGTQTEFDLPLTNLVKRLKLDEHDYDNVIANLLKEEQTYKVRRGDISPMHKIKVAQGEFADEKEPQPMQQDLNITIRELIRLLQDDIAKHVVTLRYYNLMFIRGEVLTDDEALECLTSATLLFVSLNSTIGRIQEAINKSQAKNGDDPNFERATYNRLMRRGAIFLIEETKNKVETVYEAFRENWNGDNPDAQLPSDEEVNEIEQAYFKLLREERNQEQEQVAADQNDSAEDDERVALVERDALTPNADVNDEQLDEAELPNVSQLIFFQGDSLLFNYWLDRLNQGLLRVREWQELMALDVCQEDADLKELCFERYQVALNTYVADVSLFRQLFSQVMVISATADVEPDSEVVVERGHVSTGISDAETDAEDDPDTRSDDELDSASDASLPDPQTDSELEDEAAEAELAAIARRPYAYAPIPSSPVPLPVSRTPSASGRASVGGMFGARNSTSPITADRELAHAHRSPTPG